MYIMILFIYFEKAGWRTEHYTKYWNTQFMQIIFLIMQWY